MKKIFLCIATMMMLFATSCQRVENPNAIGVESEVTFSIQTPELMTRADYGDGTTATDLTVAVYNGEAFLFKKKATMENKQANVKLSLVNGMTYNIVFWAQNANAPYTFTPESHTMVVDYSAVAANNENLDAFWKKIEYKSEGAKTQPVELTRPFAQLNVLASDWYDAVNNSKIEVKATTMKVKNVYNTMNMLTGTVENEEEVTFTENSTPHAVGQEHSSYKNADGWAWLAMNYILVDEQRLVEVEITVPNPEVNDKIYRSIPVQRNYRTNIYGRILTSDTDFNVEIKEGFDGNENITVPGASINGKYYDTFEAAFNESNAGETIVLTQDTKFEFQTVKADEPLPYLFLVDKNITIDLNGYDIWATIPDVTKNHQIFKVIEGGSLTIKGAGNLHLYTSKAVDCLAAFISNEGGTVNLNGTGEWTLRALEYPDALIPTFVDNNSTLGTSTLNIYQGTYTFHRNLFRNFSNHNDEVATINIYGGTFNGKADDSGAIWNQKPNSNIPDGAGVINVMGGTFNNVVIDDEFNDDKFITVKTAEELTDATFNASKDITILFANDIEGVAIIHQKEDVNIVVNGNGKKYDGMIDIYGYARHTGAETLKLTNINFEHANTNTALYFISCNTTEEQKRYAHNVTVENCTFIGNGSHEDAPVVGMRYRQCYNMKVVNCTAQDLHSLMWATGCTNIDVDDIEFTTGSKEGISFGTSTNLVVKNSTIETSGYGIRTDGSVNTSLSVENSTIKAEQPIIVRYNSAEYAVSINNTSLNASKAYEVVFTTGKDSEEYIAPTVNNTITGADDYNVFPRDINADELKASTGGQLNDILSKGTDVILTQNIQIQSSETGSNGYGKTGVTQLKGGTIDGQGKEVGANVWSTWDSAINTTGGTIKNVVVNKGFRGIFVSHNSTNTGKVVLENVTIDGPVYTISCDQGTNNGLEATSSTFNGWTSYAATLGDVKFTDCSFGEGSGYAFCRPYAPTEFVGCDFEEGYRLDPRAAVTFENCTIGGVALTAENLSTLVTNTSNATLK